MSSHCTPIPVANEKDKGRKGCRETGSFVRRWWTRKSLRPHRKVVGHFQARTKHAAATWPAVTPGHSPRRSGDSAHRPVREHFQQPYSWRHQTTQPRCPSAGKWLSKPWYGLIDEYWTAIKGKNHWCTQQILQMNPQRIMLSFEGGGNPKRL